MRKHQPGRHTRGVLGVRKGLEMCGWDMKSFSPALAELVGKGDELARHEAVGLGREHHAACNQGRELSRGSQRSRQL